MKIIKLIFGFVIGFLCLVVLFFAVRQIQANIQIKQEWGSKPSVIPPLVATNHLEITPLYDEDSVDKSLISDHGISYLIRTDTSTIILDLGNNPTESSHLPMIQNMQTLGITWNGIDSIVISHPHPDHTGGYEAWKNRTISMGDYSGSMDQMPIYVPIPMMYQGKSLIYSPQPVLLRPDVATTGVISYPEVFPLSLYDPLGHEQSLVVNVYGKGLVVITGCGHPTLERLVSRSEALFGLPVVGVVGGLHYETASAEEIEAHISFLKSRQPGLVALSPHDSSLQAIQAFQAAFPEAYQFVRVGSVIKFP